MVPSLGAVPVEVKWVFYSLSSADRMATLIVLLAWPPVQRTAKNLQWNQGAEK
jgi:hypothetical protein